MAFVQLDKALELFLNETYNKDDDIRDEVMLFSRSKEVQAMLLDEDFARLDWNSNYQSGVERGLEQGLNALISLVADGIITEEDAARRLNMPIEDFRTKLEQTHIPV